MEYFLDCQGDRKIINKNARNGSFFVEVTVKHF